MTGLIYLAHEASPGSPLWEQLWGLLTDPAHVLFELILEFITGVILYPVGRRFLKKYKDRVHQEVDTQHGFIHESEGEITHDGRDYPAPQ